MSNTLSVVKKIDYKRADDNKIVKSTSLCAMLEILLNFKALLCVLLKTRHLMEQKVR